MASLIQLATGTSTWPCTWAMGIALASALPEKTTPAMTPSNQTKFRAPRMRMPLRWPGAAVGRLVSAR